VDARIGTAQVLAANLADGFSSDVPQDRKRAEKLLLEALERDANRSMAHAAMGLLRRAEDRLAEARAELETAIALNRNNAWATRQLAQVFMLGGQPEPCIPIAEKAIKLNPRDGIAYMNL